MNFVLELDGSRWLSVAMGRFRLLQNDFGESQSNSIALDCSRLPLNAFDCHRLPSIVFDRFQSLSVALSSFQSLPITLDHSRSPSITLDRFRSHPIASMIKSIYFRFSRECTCLDDLMPPQVLNQFFLNIVGRCSRRLQQRSGSIIRLAG